MKTIELDVIELDVFDRNGEFLGKKGFYNYDKNQAKINQWLRNFKQTQGDILGILMADAPDFQQSDHIAILNNARNAHLIFQNIASNNLILTALYFAVRHCIPHTWENHNDQFLYPNEEWQKDSTFQNDCLIFMLFYEKNRITSKEGVNHFIPFSESQVGAKEAFESHFMHDFIKGKIKQDSKAQEKAEVKGKQGGFKNEDLYIIKPLIPTKPLEFSAEAQEVFKAGLELWKYYHSQEFKDSANPYNPNASLYDIKAYFQGFSDKGKMNPPQKAQDSYYKDLLGNLNYTLKLLAKTIEPKVYEYGFLRE